jgi:general secretion pathway protein H
VDAVAPAAARARARAGSGFTLIEMMVVIVLIAIVAGAVTVSTRPDPRKELAVQAQRVGLLMGIAAEESRLRQRSIVWEADLHGYRFVEESADTRNTFGGDDMLRERAWNPPLTRLAVIDLASGTARALVNAEAPPLRVPAAREWVQPRWRLEMSNEAASVALDFDASGHASPAP